MSAIRLLLLSVLVQSSVITQAEEGGVSPEQLFEDRIMPIFRSPKPSSCVQCHLAAVDLKNYIRPSHEATFVALREQGLINIDEPDQSEILKLIQMGEKDADRGARMIHQKTRQAELEAFAVWIKACCQDSRLRQLQLENLGAVGPDKPIEVVRHARKSRLVESFARNIWSQRMRCFPCHTPHELDSDNPKHDLPIKRHSELVDKFGQKVNIFRESPEATLDALIASSRRRIPGRYPMINIDDPVNSLLVLKPTSKLPPRNDDGAFERPSSKEPVSHMGGLKMHVNDQSYKSFVAWIQDYANVTGDRYVVVDDLPADNWEPTQKVVRLKDLPEDWEPLTPIQVFIYPPDAKNDAEPIAFTQCIVTPRRLAMGPLSVLHRSDLRPDADSLEPGAYQIRVFTDRNNRLDKSPTLLLGPDDFAGQLTINAQWKVGFPNAEVVSLAELQE